MEANQKRSTNTHFFKSLLLILLAFFLSTFFIKSYALPFTIVPNGALPQSVPLDSTITASYLVTNNTGEQRDANYVQYLPPNVSVLSSGCGTSFNLAPRGQSADSCILNLLISGPVNGSDPNPTHHLFVCFPGGISCAGTAYPLNVTQGGPALTAISIAPSSASVPAGLTQQFSATGTFSDGSTQNVNSAVNWSSSNTAVATINSSGLAQGVMAGSSATITASSGAISSNTALLTVTAPVLVSIAISPTSPNIELNGTQQFTATGIYSDGSTQPYTSLVTWQTSSMSSAPITSSGLATGQTLGTYTISATYPSFTINTATLLVTKFAYVTNSSGANVNTVSYCTASLTNGALGTCVTTGSGFDIPAGIAFNSANNVAYIANSGNDTVSYCTISPNDGSFTSCNAIPAGGSLTFDIPLGISVDPANNYVYVTNNGSNTVYSCPIDNSNGSLSTCNDTTGSGFTSPTGIVIDPANLYAYISNSGSDDNVVTCSVESGGLFSSCTNSGGTGFSNPTGISLNPANTISYMANNNGNVTSDVSYCSISSGTLSSCNTTAVGFLLSPAGITISSNDGYAFITDTNANLVYSCAIITGGSLSACAATGSGFTGPIGIFVAP